MEINKQFWEQVKAEYETDKFYRSYLCHASPTFQKVWWQPDEKNPDELVPNKEIMIIGKIFLTQNPELVEQYSLTIGETVLFASQLENSQFVKQSRVPFLEWVIKQ
jgi:hypothetical protein